MLAQANTVKLDVSHLPRRSMGRPAVPGSKRQRIRLVLARLLSKGVWPSSAAVQEFLPDVGVTPICLVRSELLRQLGITGLDHAAEIDLERLEWLVPGYAE